MRLTEMQPTTGTYYLLRFEGTSNPADEFAPLRRETVTVFVPNTPAGLAQFGEMVSALIKEHGALVSLQAELVSGNHNPARAAFQDNGFQLQQRPDGSVVSVGKASE